jgi:hypothetical protein
MPRLQTGAKPLRRLPYVRSMLLNTPSRFSSSCAGGSFRCSPPHSHDEHRVAVDDRLQAVRDSVDDRYATRNSVRIVFG